ncbi:MAG: hypothetical protein ACE360_11870 [Hyphomicrobiales bacterium]
MVDAEIVAALAGAVTGAIVGGGVTWIVQKSQLRFQRKLIEDDLLERRRALAHSLVLKLIKIGNDISTLRKHVEDGLAESNDLQMWSGVVQISNLPEPIRLTSEELWLLAKAKDGLFNKSIQIDTIHHGYIRLLSNYSARRTELGDMLPQTRRATGAGHFALEPDERKLLEPRMIELNTMLTEIVEKGDRDQGKVEAVLFRAIDHLNVTLDLDLKFEKSN